MLEHPRRITLLALLALVAILGAACASSGEPTPTVATLAPEVSVAQAAAFRDAGAFVLDVREPSEWVTGHIPGATLIPLGQLASRVDEVPTDRTVVVVCHSGNRSAQGRDLLRQAGFTNVTSMAGGMTDWTQAGQPVVTGS